MAQFPSPTGTYVDQPNPGIEFAQAQKGYHDNAEARRNARMELEAKLKQKAQANHDAAKATATAFLKHRGSGQPVEASKILAKADAAHHVLTADIADAEAKAAQARLAELEGERASLRQLIDWTREESG